MSYRVPLWVALAGCLTAVVTDAQSTPPPQTIEAAEGARYPKASGGAEQAMYDEAFGPKERKCVDADEGKHVAARSGEFVAGPFDRHVMFGSPKSARRKVWWAEKGKWLVVVSSETTGAVSSSTKSETETLPRRPSPPIGLSESSTFPENDCDAAADEPVISISVLMCEP